MTNREIKNMKETFLQEEFAELRWRRDIEDRIIRWFITISSGLITASLALAQFADPIVFAVFAILTAVLIWRVNFHVTKKIEAENAVYQGIGKTIVKTLENDFSLTNESDTKESIGSDIAKLGTGGGYQKTNNILNASARLTFWILVATGITNLAINLFPQVCI